MQTVSQAWKENQQQNLVSESYVEIVLSVTDPDAQENAQALDNGAEAFSDTESIVKESVKAPVKYVTGELNIWGLDGTFTILPNEPPYGANGYVGNALCGPDCVYSGEIPTITISFSRVFENLIPGLTITWATAYNEWAEKFRITAYNGSSIVSRETFSGNTDMTSVVFMDIQNYNKITVEVLKWCLPYRRARIESIQIGIERTYSKSEIMNFSHSISVDPLSAELPKAEIVFEVSNLNGEYNPDNPQGVAKYLLERQEITTRYGYKLGNTVEWIDGGRFFISAWDTPQNGITATFTARDILEYMGDTYSGPSSGTLLSIATAALEQAALPLLPGETNRWSLGASLENITAADNADLSKNTIAEVLQYVANAGCCVMYQDRHGIFHIEPLADGQTNYEINRFNSYSNSEISLTKQLKAVDINNGQYVLTVGTVGETQPVINPLISDARASAVAQWVANYLVNRKNLSGEFRADPRLDALDRVKNENQFAASVVLVTEIKYTYNGAFKGNYQGKQGA